MSHGWAGEAIRTAYGRLDRVSEPVSAQPLAVDVIDIDDPDDLRVDDFRDLNSVDRRPDLPTLPGGRPGKGLVIAEGVLVAQRMIASRFTPHAFLGVDKRLNELSDDLRNPSLSGVPFYRASAEVMAEIVGFHLNRGVLGVARRPAALEVDDVLATWSGFLGERATVLTRADAAEA